MKRIKAIVKRGYTAALRPLFKRRAQFPILRHYPKGRDHLFDIINSYEKCPSADILDVGANIGQSALTYVRLFPQSRVFCFEPVQATYETLTKNVSEYSRVKTFHSAVGAEPGTAPIQICPHDSELSSLIDNVTWDADPSDIETVNVVCLDDFIRSTGITRVGILKIDTEGYEMQVLRGARRSIEERIFDFIFCEVGFRGESHKGQFADICEHLWNHRYIFCGLYDEYRIGPAASYVQFANALFMPYEQELAVDAT